MTSRRQGRDHIICPGCRLTLAYIRPEWIVLKRLLITDNATGHDRENGVVTIRCRCGQATIVRWALFQG